MKILIVGNSNNHFVNEVRTYYQKYVEFFEKSSKTSSVDAIIETTLFDDLIIKVGDGVFSIYDIKNQRDLCEYDALFMRGDAFRNSMDVVCTISEYAHVNNVPIINDYSSVRDSSKLLQAVHFHKVGVPIAQTLLVNAATLSTDNDLDWVFPCVMKAVHGSHGNDNHIVKNLEDVNLHVNDQPNKRFVLQRLVPNNCDYRILVVGDETLVIRRSAVGDTHLNNTSQDGAADLVDISEIPQKVMDDVRKVMDSYNMTIAGVDVFSDKNTKEFFFLEVNSQPQLMTGAYLDKKEEIVGKFLKKLSNKN